MGFDIVAWRSIGEPTTCTMCSPRAPQSTTNATDTNRVRTYASKRLITHFTYLVQSSTTCFIVFSLVPLIDIDIYLKHNRCQLFPCEIKQRCTLLFPCSNSHGQREGGWNVILRRSNARLTLTEVGPSELFCNFLEMDVGKSTSW